MSFGKAFRRSKEVHDSSIKATNDSHKALDLTKHQSYLEKQHNHSEKSSLYISDTHDVHQSERKYTKKSVYELMDIHDDSLPSYEQAISESKSEFRKRGISEYMHTKELPALPEEKVDYNSNGENRHSHHKYRSAMKGLWKSFSSESRKENPTLRESQDAFIVANDWINNNRDRVLHFNGAGKSANDAWFNREIKGTESEVYESYKEFKSGKYASKADYKDNIHFYLKKFKDIHDKMIEGN